MLGAISEFPCTGERPTELKVGTILHDAQCKWLVTVLCETPLPVEVARDFPTRMGPAKGRGPYFLVLIQTPFAVPEYGAGIAQAGSWVDVIHIDTEDMVGLVRSAWHVPGLTGE